VKNPCGPQWAALVGIEPLAAVSPKRVASGTSFTFLCVMPMIRSRLNNLHGSPRKFQDARSGPHAQRHALTAITRQAFSFCSLRQANVCCIQEVALALQPLHHSLLPSSTPHTSTIRSESSDHQISRIFNIILSRLFRLDSYSQTVDIALWSSRDIYNNQL
jgi:hypothetical protein